MHKPETASSDIDAALPPGESARLCEKMQPADKEKPEFDKFARSYEALIKPWLKLAGASREYFARSRLTWFIGSPVSARNRTDAGEGFWLWNRDVCLVAGHSPRGADYRAGYIGRFFGFDRAALISVLLFVVGLGCAWGLLAEYFNQHFQLPAFLGVASYRAVAGVGFILSAFLYFTFTLMFNALLETRRASNRP